MDAGTQEKSRYKNKPGNGGQNVEGGGIMKKLIMALALAAAAAAPLYARLVDKILVKVNDEVILQSEVDETVDLLATQSKMQGKETDKRAMEKDVLKNMIEQKLIITMAKDENVSISEEAVADKTTEFIDTLRKRFTTESDFEDALLKEGMSYTDFRMKIDAQVRDNLAFTKVKQKKQQEFISKAAVTDEELKSYYNANKAAFKVNDMMNLTQLAIDRLKTDAKDINKYAAELSARITAEGFDKVSAELSGKPGIKIVEAGWIDTVVMSKNIRDALSGLKKGAISKPVETDDGVLILKVTDLKRGSLQNFDDVKESVRIKVIEEKVDKMWNEWISKVKKEAFIKYM
jgi:parvulin-like peptidyl-prolyl isomerase